LQLTGTALAAAATVRADDDDRRVLGPRERGQVGSRATAEDAESIAAARVHPGGAREPVEHRCGPRTVLLRGAVWRRHHHGWIGVRADSGKQMDDEEWQLEDVRDRAGDGESRSVALVAPAADRQAAIEAARCCRSRERHGGHGDFAKVLTGCGRNGEYGAARLCRTERNATETEPVRECVGSPSTGVSRAPVSRVRSTIRSVNRGSATAVAAPSDQPNSDPSAARPPVYLMLG
jgi:hypothetical protein